MENSNAEGKQWVCDRDDVYLPMQYIVLFEMKNRWYSSGIDLECLQNVRNGQLRKISHGSADCLSVCMHNSLFAIFGIHNTYTTHTFQTPSHHNLFIQFAYSDRSV